MTPASPISTPEDTMLALHGADVISQAIRWVNKTYIYARVNVSTIAYTNTLFNVTTKLHVAM